MHVLSPTATTSAGHRTRADESLCLRLRGVTRNDLERVGGKAANLGELHAAGFNVPDGIVVTTAAYAVFREPLDGCVDYDQIAAAPIPTRVAAAIRDALGNLADVPVAVRSSAVGEDLAVASFAGQYDTVLDVRGVDAILAAVRRCWASMFTPRVMEYRAQRGLAPTLMGVIIQRLVDSDTAGVAFSANPITGVRDECIVSAVRGLGERLVSGEATPDEWVVRANAAERTISPEDAIDEARAREVAALARRAQDHFGSPQDVEWATRGDALFILQSRPITALPAEPVPLPVEPPEGFWEQDPSHFPEPVSPLYRRSLTAMEAACREDFEWAGFLLDGMAWQQIGGRVYNRMIPLGGKDRKPPPNWLVPIVMPIMRRVVPSLRKRIARCVEAYRGDEYVAAVRHWCDVGRDDMIARNRALREIDNASLSDEDLVHHLRELFTHADYGFHRHARVALALIVVYAEFMVFALDALGWPEHELTELFAGTSERSTAPARSLTALAKLAADNPTVMAVLESGGPACGDRLAEADPAFARAFARHRYDHGCRTTRMDILSPTLGEDAGLLARLVVGQVKRGKHAEELERRAGQRRAERREQARAELADRPEVLAEFERLLERATVAYPIREDNAYFTHGVPGALLRFAALEAGRRLADRGDIDDQDDVFFFLEEELFEAMLQPGDRRALVKRRRGEHVWALHADLPATFGSPPPKEPPPMGWMPGEMRRVMGALLWGIESANAPSRSATRQDGNGGIHGLAASHGIYEGTVRVIVSEDEFGKLEPGDVLVCRVTSPVWSFLFSSVGALVADSGGASSHQAIISREYGIPAVVATGNATELLQDGQRVRVDGSRGRVEVLS